MYNSWLEHTLKFTALSLLELSIIGMISCLLQALFMGLFVALCLRLKIKVITMETQTQHFLSVTFHCHMAKRYYNPLILSLTGQGGKVVYGEDAKPSYWPAQVPFRSITGEMKSNALKLVAYCGALHLNQEEELDRVRLVSDCNGDCLFYQSSFIPLNVDLSLFVFGLV